MAQATHAAFQLAVEHPLAIEEWHRLSNYLVILASRDLASDADRVEAHPLSALVRVTEPDLAGNPLTAVAIVPGVHVGRLVSNLPLALREPVVT